MFGDFSWLFSAPDLPTLPSRVFLMNTEFFAVNWIELDLEFIFNFSSLKFGENRSIAKIKKPR